MRKLTLVLLAAAGVTALTAASPPREVKPSVPRDQPAAEILSEVVLAQQPKRYIGWPTITRAANGDLLVAFSGDRDWHVCPWGKIYLIRSTDEGKTWSAPEVIADTPLDDRGVGLTTLPDGSIVVAFEVSLAFDDPKVERYKPYRDYAASLTPDIRKKWQGAWMRVSKDHGKTWGQFLKCPTNTPHGPSSLSNGDLIYVRPGVFTSADQGQNWTQLASLIRDPATWRSRYAFLSEQHAAEAADGRIVALSRYANKKGAPTDNRLRLIESADGGKTWTKPEPTAMVGYPAHILRLKNNWLLAVYGRRVTPLGERACLSKDGGKTWLTDQEIILSNAVKQDSGDMGYPSSAQLPDGSIWTVYYQVEKSADGHYPCLMATHWKLKP